MNERLVRTNHVCVTWWLVGHFLEPRGCGGCRAKYTTTCRKLFAANQSWYDQSTVSGAMSSFCAAAAAARVQSHYTTQRLLLKQFNCVSQNLGFAFPIVCKGATACHRRSAKWFCRSCFVSVSLISLISSCLCVCVCGNV